MKKIILTTLLCLAGCAHHAKPSNENVNLALEQSHTMIKVGETVTFTAHASGVSGRREKIRWEARGGDLDRPNDEERYAQVAYRNPGTYSVTASLWVDGDLIDQETAVVRVQPLS